MNATTEYDRLAGIEFPAEVSGLVLGLRSADRQSLDLEQRLAAELSDAAYLDLLGELEDANRGVAKALAEVRSALRLPDTPDPSA
ncbi:MAG: hypothetical protein ABR509_00745 [Candidatus Limnocylindria bacterium]